jgi:hypothetical protein
MFGKRTRSEIPDKKESMMIDTTSGMELFENLEIARLTSENLQQRQRHEK